MRAQQAVRMNRPATKMRLVVWGGDIQGLDDAADNDPESCGNEDDLAPNFDLNLR